MTPDVITQTVIRIIAGQAMIPESAVTLDASPTALGLDSLGLVEAIFAIEEAFDITIPFNANGNSGGAPDFDMSSIAAVVAAVQALVAAKTT
jgi:acyl carrier protein